MQKFKEGALVEIINSAKGNEGCRFIVGEVQSNVWSQDAFLQAGMDSYKTNIPCTDGGYGSFLWSPEDALKLVVDDGNVPSEYTSLEELLDNLVGVEV